MTLQARNEGSLWLLIPQDDAAQDWLDAHTAGQWFGGGLVVEPRYVDDIVQGFEGAGGLVNFKL